jgi:hypothetical protein
LNDGSGKTIYPGTIDRGFTVFKYITLILWRVRALLCNDREKGGYTRAVSWNRLCKHVPVARQQIINNATVGPQQWKRSVFCAARVEVLLARYKVNENPTFSSERMLHKAYYLKSSVGKISGCRPQGA